MNSFNDIFSNIDPNGSYTPEQLQEFFLELKSQINELSEKDNSVDEVRTQPSSEKKYSTETHIEQQDDVEEDNIKGESLIISNEF